MMQLARQLEDQHWSVACSIVVASAVAMDLGRVGVAVDQCWPAVKEVLAHEAVELLSIEAGKVSVVQMAVVGRIADYMDVVGH